MNVYKNPTCFSRWSVSKDLYLKYLIEYNDIDAYNEIKDGGNWKEYLEEEDLNLLFSFANEHNLIQKELQ